MADRNADTQDQLRDEMLPGGNIDIHASARLQADHHGSKLFQFNIAPLSALTDLIVMAECVRKLAVGDGNRIRSPAPDKQRLLAKMQPIV